ncbi:hypothetical protein, partial [Xenorhabdus szentirmaii]|uniref:hypothetical protein n=1 Tax=Xenorhabdus szentirmaii TaxID=290112 RepID=UPI002B4039AE
WDDKNGCITIMKAYLGTTSKSQSSEHDASGLLSCVFIFTPSFNQQYTLLNNMKAEGYYSAGEHQ